MLVGMTDSAAETETTGTTDRREEDVRAVVARLSRRHPSGGTVIERAAILAEGRDAHDVVEWVIAHGGEPESADVAPARGLHGARMTDRSSSTSAPLRYVLPAGAFAGPPATEAAPL